MEMKSKMWDEEREMRRAQKCTKPNLQRTKFGGGGPKIKVADYDLKTFGLGIFEKRTHTIETKKSLHFSRDIATKTNCTCVKTWTCVTRSLAFGSVSTVATHEIKCFPCVPNFHPFLSSSTENLLQKSRSQKDLPPHHLILKASKFFTRGWGKFHM